MPYEGSYIWRMRQKIGHDLLVMPCVEVTAVRDGKIERGSNASLYGGFCGR